MSNSPDNAKYQPDPTVPLFDEFEKIDRQGWEATIERDLKGADYKNKLSWQTDEGFSVLPFYTLEDLDGLDFTPSNPGEFPFQRGYRSEHSTCSCSLPLLEFDVEEIKKNIQHAQDASVDSFYLPIRIEKNQNNSSAKLRSANLTSQEDITSLLECSLNQDIHLIVEADAATPFYAAAMDNFVKQHGDSSSALKADFLYDPLTVLLFEDSFYSNYKNWVASLEELIQYAEKRLLPFRMLGINAGRYHNAGADAVQELALSLSIVTEYVDRLTDKNLSLETVLSHIFLSISIGGSYFKEIAKLRAARMLWANWVQSFQNKDTEPPALPVYSFTSLWNKTDYDPHTNMLRTTTEAMSAAIGGSDLLVIHPYDYRFRQPDEFSKHIARNQHFILNEEAHFPKVDDPAGGSYYVEMLTDKLARNAWRLFQEIEEQGGFYKSAQKGLIQNMVKESRDKKMGDLARRKNVMVGINDYPDSEDSALERAREGHIEKPVPVGKSSFDISPESSLHAVAEALQKGALLGDFLPEQLPSKNSDIETISTGNIAASFRQLRLQTEKFEEQNDYRPQVFTMPLGNRKWASARATFSTNFFGVAGYSINENIPFESVDEAIEELRETGAEITVLCSSDKEYADLVPEVVEKMKQASVDTTLVLAGNPGKQQDFYRSHGVHYFIYKGINILNFLEEMHNEMEITE